MKCSSHDVEVMVLNIGQPKLGCVVFLSHLNQKYKYDLGQKY